MNSSFLKINWQDLGKALILLFISVVAGALLPVIDGGNFPTQADLIAAAILGLKAAGLYLVKNFLSNSIGQFGKKEPAPPEEPAA